MENGSGGLVVNEGMVLLEFVRGQVVETRMRPDPVVVLPPGLDDDLRFAARAKHTPFVPM